MKRKKVGKFIVWLCSILVACLFPVFTFAENEGAFTPEELAKFNGRDGARAYVAVNGRVYDMTGNPLWPGGKHFCPGAVAGKDITGIWGLSPASHFQPNYLKRFPEVGRLVTAQTQSQNSPSPNVSPQPTAQVQQGGDEVNPRDGAVRQSGSRINPIIWGLVGIGLGLLVWLWFHSQRK